MPDAAPSPITPLRATMLGLIEGPTELMPVSSSAHLGLAPRLLRWRGWDECDAGERKALEVVLHAGAGGALAWSMREELRAELHLTSGRRLVAHGIAFAVPAAAGLALERPIQERLGGRLSIAAGLAAGAVAMLAADRAPGGRRREELGPADGFAIGVAQALALMPGVSRGGATVTAARLRGFDREAAAGLSRLAALPVIAGAAALKATRLARRRRVVAPALASGALAAFVATLVANRALPAKVTARLWPFAVYRVVLAAACLTAPRQPRVAVESRPTGI